MKISYLLVGIIGICFFQSAYSMHKHLQQEYEDLKSEEKKIKEAKSKLENDPASPSRKEIALIWELGYRLSEIKKRKSVLEYMMSLHIEMPPSDEPSIPTPILKRGNVNGSKDDDCLGINSTTNLLESYFNNLVLQRRGESMKPSVLDTITPQYIVDGAGKKIGVVLDLATFRLIIEELEDLHDARHAEIILAGGKGEEGRILEEIEASLHKQDR